MCVIIIKQKKNQIIDRDILENSADINPHGLGVVWLDTYEIEYYESDKYEVLVTNRPFVAHFRYATVGSVTKENMHPFRCGSNKYEYLMQNGTIYELGDKCTTDTEHLAKILGTISRHKWKDELAEFDCRFVTVNTRRKTFQIYNKADWVRRDGIWYSKANVLARHYIAVYGTLKFNHSNYYHYLYDSPYVGSGHTTDKYPLVIDGLPYLVDRQGIGYNVSVDVFRVDDDTLAKIDTLEGHPDWYCRKQIDILVGRIKPKVVKCWIYFNPTQIDSQTKFHREYSERISLGRSYRNMGWDDDWDDYNATIETATMLSDSEQEQSCPNCDNELESGGFDLYYCHQCVRWFTENDLSYTHNACCDCGQLNPCSYSSARVCYHPDVYPHC